MMAITDRSTYQAFVVQKNICGGARHDYSDPPMRSMRARHLPNVTRFCICCWLSLFSGAAFADKISDRTNILCQVTSTSSITWSADIGEDKHHRIITKRGLDRILSMHSMRINIDHKLKQIDTIECHTNTLSDDRFVFDGSRIFCPVGTSIIQKHPQTNVLIYSFDLNLTSGAVSYRQARELEFHEIIRKHEQIYIQAYSLKYLHPTTIYKYPSVVQPDVGLKFEMREIHDVSGHCR